MGWGARNGASPPNGTWSGQIPSSPLPPCPFARLPARVAASETSLLAATPTVRGNPRRWPASRARRAPTSTAGPKRRWVPVRSRNACP